MGTLFHTIFKTEAAELRLMREMGYDVVTFGNHDFDFRNDGLAAALHRAKQEGLPPPEIVAANIVFSGDNAEKALREAFLKYPVKDYMVLEKNGLRIGVFGLMGKDAADDAPFAGPLRFADSIATAKRVVETLKNQEQADIIVCLSHSGTRAVKKRSEDEMLARAAPQIDVIVSGHTHTVLKAPLLVGKTVIVSSGSYGEYLGVLDLAYEKDRGVKTLSYELKPVTHEIEEDTRIAVEIEKFKKIANHKYLAHFGYRYDEIIAESDFHFDSLASIYARPRETGLGNLITDAYRFAVKQAEGENYDYIHLVIDPLGLIRSSFRQGIITTADIFGVLSLGLGMDGHAGYPLVTAYITGDEIKDLLEVETSVAPRKTDAHLQISGVVMTYNPHRLLFDRVIDVQVRDADGVMRPLEPRGLYRICINYYTAMMVEFVQRASFGLIRVVPKDKAGRPLREWQDALVDADPSMPGVQELKEWVALAIYMRSFPDTDGNGIPNIPDSYRHAEGRIVVMPSWNPLHLITGGNIVTWGFLGVVTLATVLLFLLLTGIRKRRR